MFKSSKKESTEEHDGGDYVEKVTRTETHSVQEGGQWKTVKTETVTVRSQGGNSSTIRTYMNKDDFLRRQSKFNNPDPEPITIKRQSRTITADARPIETKRSPSPKEKKSIKSDKKESSSDSDDDDDDFNENLLKAHNDYRQKHGVTHMKLSKSLSKFSQEWADQLAKEEAFRHRPNNKYGENIYMKWSSDPQYKLKGHEAADSWYSEIKDHRFGMEPTSLKSGHFTQLVWKTSKELGVGVAKSKSGKIIVVCNYEPAGNMMGTFTANVPPPKN